MPSHQPRSLSAAVPDPQYPPGMPPLLSPALIARTLHRLSVGGRPLVDQCLEVSQMDPGALHPRHEPI